MSPWWRRPAGEEEDATAESQPESRPESRPEPAPAERSAAASRSAAAETAPARTGDETPGGAAPQAKEERRGAEGPVHIEDTLLAGGEEDEEEEVDETPAAEEGEEQEPARPSSRRRRSRRRSGSAATAPAQAPTPPSEEEDDSERRPARRRPAPAVRAVANGGRPRRLEGGSAEEPTDLTDLMREFLSAVPERLESGDERKIALFCDLENIAIGVRDSEVKKFDINLVLERLLEKGKIIVKKAYADWERYSEYKRAFHASAIEMIDIPQKYYSGKNSADIKMVVDAMDLCYSKEHLDTFVILSGDSDFSPLVSKLKENNKYVIGCGVKKSSSSLLIDNCDEFIYYEDVWRDSQRAPLLDGLSEQKAEAFTLMVDAIQALMRENKDVLWGSMIKQTMQRKRPSFNEGYYGYDSFSDLLEDAEKAGIVKLKKDRRSGSYIVVGFTNPHQ